ncbi:MAG: fibronectin type III-like domain-contianing protein, partial [Bacteroidales bacterium]|nr:fibronectin type III-like domain-contianing protein [Bacteroidales bacterium]
GRPLSLPWAKETVPAILEAWEPGMMGGQAIVEVLFGEVNPSGKLPVTIPYNVGQVPTIYNHKHSQYSRQFAIGQTGCLYPFGYGLSYTTFSYHDGQLTKTEMTADDSCELRIWVTNTGDREGTEIVQLYIQDEYGSVTRPVKELKGFQRVDLKAGESKQVKFVISPEQLQFYTARQRWEVEPGDFKIMVGSSSADEDLTVFKLKIK